MILTALEVKPLFSPHPVETTILYFRVRKADTPIQDIWLIWLMLFPKGFWILLFLPERDPGISREWFDSIWEGYLEKADIKKIDIGGGLIHGSAVDFSDDPSETAYTQSYGQTFNQRGEENR